VRRAWLRRGAGGARGGRGHLASLAGSHAPTTIRRRLPAAGATARLLLFGFVEAPRRSELVALRIEDVGVVGCSIAVAAAILT
jgi:hypothetical protein